jgi:hypothetical protein
MIVCKYYKVNNVIHTMNNKPISLTPEEMKEIAEIEDIREMWGANSIADMERILDQEAYAVKFNYHSGSPGYVGDYFILQGDALGEAIELFRGKDKKLMIIDERTV